MKVQAKSANSAVLKWARETAGLSVEEAADKLGRPAEEVRAWEGGTAVPTFSQLERLAASIYKRPVAIFFFPDPPPEENFRQEFRTLPDSEFEKLFPDTRLALRQARAFQLSLSELAVGAAAPTRFITRNVNPSPSTSIAELAQEVRRYLDVSVNEQRSWKNTKEAFKVWRDSVEGAGVFAFKRPFDEKVVSGFCLHSDEFPLIMINNSHAHTRQIFTLFHELGHLLFGFSGITTTDVHFELRIRNESREIERKCNQFASEFLLPSDSFPLGLFDERDLEEAVRSVASDFNISREVVLRKLLDAHRVDQSKYEEYAQRWVEEAQAAKAESSAGGNYYANQVTYLGNAFISIGFDHLRAGNVSLGELADHFGMKAKTVARLEQYLLGREAS